MTDKKNLQHYRDEIDRLDLELLALLNQRATYATQIGQLKRAEKSNSILDSTREKEILDRLLEHNTGPLNQAQVSACFDLIMQHSRELQEALQHD